MFGGRLSAAKLRRGQGRNGNRLKIFRANMRKPVGRWAYLLSAVGKGEAGRDGARGAGGSTSGQGRGHGAGSVLSATTQTPPGVKDGNTNPPWRVKDSMPATCPTPRHSRRVKGVVYLGTGRHIYTQPVSPDGGVSGKLVFKFSSVGEPIS